MSFRESDLSRLHSGNGSSAGHRYPDMMNLKSVSKTEVLRHNRPDSMMSSASERILASSLRERPLLLKRNEGRARTECLHRPSVVNGYQRHFNNDGINGHGQELVVMESLDSKGRKVISSGDEDDQNEVDTLIDSQAYLNIDEKENENIEEVEDDEEAIPGVSYIDSYADVGVNLESLGQQSAKVTKKSVKLRPSSAPRRLFDKFQGTDLRVVKKQQQHAVSTFIKERSASVRSHPWSGRSNFTTASSVASGHNSRCSIPGRHEINKSNTRSIAGPHSDLNSLLGDAPCPRPPSGNIHHKSAWYHVPGRYSTPKHFYPKKRMQKTENAKDIESFITLKTHWAKRKAYEEKRKQQKMIAAGAGEDGDQKEANSDSSDVGKLSYTSFNSFMKNQTSLNHRHKPILMKNETPRLMISGLDMAPEPRYGEEPYMTLPRSHGHGVKFKEPIHAG